MVFEDEFVIQQPIELVWDFFIDILTVSTCVPGVERMEQVGEGTYTGNLRVRVGPIGADFVGQVTIVNADPPCLLVAKVEGKDRATTSIINGDFTANLQEVEGGSTAVHHQLDIAIRGRLGQFGTGVIQEVAKDVTAHFLACVQEKIAKTATPLPGPQPNDAVTDDNSSDTAMLTTTATRSPGLLKIIARAALRSIGNALRRFLPGSATKS